MNAGSISLIGVYDADGSFAGEIRYWVGARLGRTHCSLCEITHGPFVEKSEWRNYRASLNVDFTTFHRDDAPADILEASGHRFPVVLARSGDRLLVVLSPEQLEICDGDVKKFQVALAQSCAAEGFALE
ncbi:unannotated protein [freshwater metagenome]|uniref:Unannotated protein n=1 Tax=freshwater metagenome TaxID=449393 RepID=A0A6J6GP16_9ZZZZ|nr:hypothetical protein [Actinomycetota bacterium]